MGKEMFEIKIPETPASIAAVKLMDGTVGEFTFARFVELVVDTSKEFSTGGPANWRAGARLIEAVDGASDGVAMFRREDRKMLLDVISAADWRAPLPGRKLIAYAQAIEDAKAAE